MMPRAELTEPHRVSAPAATPASHHRLARMLSVAFGFRRSIGIDGSWSVPMTGMKS
jgi:hypothetical protein